MSVLLPIPPQGSALFDPKTGQMTDVWRNYYLSLENALSDTSAPRNAQYVVATSNSELTNERNLGALGSGYVKSTVTAGEADLTTEATIPISDLGAGEVLTRESDTNVTLTLGGSPTTSLLAPVTITAGWSGQLGLARGGTNADLSATGGTSQVLKQTSVGGAVSVAQLTLSDIVDGTNLSRRVSSVTTPVSTTGTTEEVLATYSMPANTLASAGQGIRLTGGFTQINTGNSKTFRVRVGGLAGTVVANLAGFTGLTAGYFDVLFQRVTSTTGIAAAFASVNFAETRSTSVTTDFTGSVDIVITGLTPTASGDLTLQQASFMFTG
jgi:hypothetical protein